MLSWAVRGNGPFVAYQFNPLDNVNPVYSNDASLLLPTSAGGLEYMALTGDSGAYVTVVGIKEETHVTVIPSAPTVAGGAMPAALAGTPIEVTLGPGEVFSLRSDDQSEVGGDLSGTRVVADKPVVAFAGNEATISDDACCADHLEQQLVPVAKWGQTFVAARSWARGVAPDHYRILAARDDTAITFDPPVHSPVTLTAGEWIGFESKEDFIVEADGPIMVSQILASSHEVTRQGRYCAVDGDCSSGQVCRALQIGAPGQCYQACELNRGSCPSDALVCHYLFGWLELNVPGEGICLPRACGGDEGECPAGVVCVEGIMADGGDACFEPCMNPSDCGVSNAFCGAWQDEGYCIGAPCDSSAECGSSASCVGDTGNAYCTRQCVPDSSCKDAGYYCVDAENDVDICLPATCRTQGDCPQAHRCTGATDLTDGMCNPIGDPAMIYPVPLEQLRSDYVFLTPEGFVEDYMTLFVPMGAQVALDGNPLSDESFRILAGEYRVYVVALSDGTHRIEADAPVGAIVYGFDDDVSYGYPAGTEMSDLW